MDYSDRRLSAAGPKEDPEGLYLIDEDDMREPVVDEEEADYFKELKFE